ncbi:TetR/AcrR family transcriptional regulator [Mycolicibacterium helvum]|nr:TetR/AcrR family transcriptional regulator [Mycolicibacterium helvum]
MALIKAAQSMIAAGRHNVPVLEITQAADVGMGSFYNHFESKEELFEAAVGDVLDQHGAVLDQLTADIEDPAAVFACSFRLSGRFFRERPQESRILLDNWGALLSSDRGLAPRAMRDIKAAVAAGRFHVEDPELTLSVAAGALLGLGYLLQVRPDRDAGATADAVTQDVLRLFGMSAQDAHEVCTLPLPAVTFQE